MLNFEAELLVDGRMLERSVNYGLARIIPPANMPVNESKRPFIVFDPRAGQAPGIGGMKHDSEIGEALAAGHPRYFVGFLPNPVPGQTVEDVCRAEVHFIETVAARHRKSSGKPALIGNCQAGWQVMRWPAQAIRIVASGARGGVGRCEFSARLNACAERKSYAGPIRKRRASEQDGARRRGVVASYETVRRWCKKFGQTFAGRLRRRRLQPGDKWYLDEVFIRIQGVQHYLWRPVDQEGVVLDILVQPRRDAKAAKRFFRRLLKGLQYVPRVSSDICFVDVQPLEAAYAEPHRSFAAYRSRSSTVTSIHDDTYWRLGISRAPDRGIQCLAAGHVRQKRQRDVRSKIVADFRLPDEG